MLRKIQDYLRSNLSKKQYIVVTDILELAEAYGYGFNTEEDVTIYLEALKPLVTLLRIQHHGHND